MDLNKYIYNLNNQSTDRSYNHHHCNCNCNYKCYKKWSEIPYPEATSLPVGKDPSAGTWPLHYIKKLCNNCYYSLFNEKICFNLKDPNKIDFEKDLIEVENVQANLTDDQKSLAKYWGTGVPPQQWLPIFLQLIDEYKVAPSSSARILSCLQNAMSDAFTITWMFKYYYNAARPCQLNRNLKTYLATPMFPTYPSGHSVVSGATEIVLSFFFPKEAALIHQMAEDASISRLYGGIHFRSDLSEGLKLGRQIGNICIEYLKTEHEIDKLIFKG